MTCPLIFKTRKFSYYNAKKQGLRTDPDYVKFIEMAQVTVIVPPRMDKYIAVNMEIQGIFQNYGSPDDIYPYSIDEGFIDLTSSLNYFVPDQQISRKDKLDMLSARIQRDIWRQTGIYSRSACRMPIPCLLSWPWIMKPSTHRLCEPIGLTKTWKISLVHSKNDRLLGGLDIGWRSA